MISAGWALLKREDGNDRNAVGRTVSASTALRDAFYPLTLPLTVGPGSISVAIKLGANEPRHLGTNLLSIVAAAIGSAFVKAHLKHIMEKLGASDRTQAVMIAVRRGIIQL